MGGFLPAGSAMVLCQWVQLWFCASGFSHARAFWLEVQLRIPASTEP